MKTAALLAFLMFTAGVLSSCERERSIPEKITAIYSALNELDQDIKRFGSKTDTLESKTERLGSNTDTSWVTYLEGRVGALEKRMHDLERQPHR